MKNVQLVKDLLLDSGTQTMHNAFDYIAATPSDDISARTLENLFREIPATVTYSEVGYITRAIALAFPQKISLLAHYIAANFPPNESFKIGLIIGLLTAGEIHVQTNLPAAAITYFDDGIFLCLEAAVLTGGSSLLNSTMTGDLSNAIGAYMKWSDQPWSHYRFSMVGRFLKEVKKDKQAFRAQTLRMVLVEKIAVKYFTLLTFHNKLEVLTASLKK